MCSFKHFWKLRTIVFDPCWSRVHNSEVVCSGTSIVCGRTVVPDDDNLFRRFKVANRANVAFAAILEINETSNLTFKKGNIRHWLIPRNLVWISQLSYKVTDLLKTMKQDDYFWLLLKQVKFFEAATCRQFHQHSMYEFFVRTSFRQLFSSYMNVEIDT
jgi:hypothetical protein